MRSSTHRLAQPYVSDPQLAHGPPRVANVETYWTEPPPERSARCAWWLRRIEAGWRRNRRVSTMGYSSATEHFGVYIWEYLHVLSPALNAAEALS